MSKTEYERMLAGELYVGSDADSFQRKAELADAKCVLDAVSNNDLAARIEACQVFFTENNGPCLVLDPFTIQFGHVRLGEWAFVNFGATFMDANYITLGNFVAVGPNVQFITDTHPAKPEERYMPPEDGDSLPFRIMNRALPITLHDYCWIGAGAILMPGVTIGEGAVVGAGSVVTRDVPPRTIVVGNPARVLRHLDDD